MIINSGSGLSSCLVPSHNLSWWCLLSIESQGTNFGKIWIKIKQNTYKNVPYKMPSILYGSLAYQYACVLLSIYLLTADHSQSGFMAHTGIIYRDILLPMEWSTLCPGTHCIHKSYRGDSSLNRTINTFRTRQDGRHFPDDIFKCIFLNENIWISIKISLKFVPKGPINNIPALVQIMAWRRPGKKPLSEPMLIFVLMHIYVTRPQWVKEAHEHSRRKIYAWRLI